ncbi:Uma2 family endonuclease [Streptomyces violens]|uniref:Uma2 family endonuclease n=1 Tax=Streptomyces violens TaxID=66377 RepID=UPI0004C088D1|nr:Uma2 family endonuclease [Streptomyces violens]
MTITESDCRIEIEMADIDECRLDEMFERLERMPVPEGYKVEIVEGTVYMSPQRDNHWDIILEIVDQLRAKYPKKQIKSDVRIDYPGGLNGLCSDVTALKDGAVKTDKGRWRCEDVEFVAEVISKDTARNDYGPKLAAYATAGVPVYLVVDPYVGKCHLYTLPKEGEYTNDLAVTFGMPVDLTTTVVGLEITTDEFARG